MARSYINIENEEMAANGQRRIWARVCGVSGELVMVKVDPDTDDATIEQMVNNILAAQEQTVTDERARLEAELAAITARLAELQG